MGEAIGQILPLAVVVAFSPMPIVAVVLMLGALGSCRNGSRLRRSAGSGSRQVVGGIILAVSGPADASDRASRATWVDWLSCCSAPCSCCSRSPSGGVGPLERRGADARARWGRSTPSPRSKRSAPAWRSRPNPKNLLVIIGAAAADAETGILGRQADDRLAHLHRHRDGGRRVPVVMYYALGDRAARVPRSTQDVDDPQQQRRDGGALPDHRRQADRR